ncbi:MAG: AAA family ATPase [Kiritimatiellae bacterium]|nr:AAA family ATPase [Kiritimatiellia bacterium]
MLETDLSFRRCLCVSIDWSQRLVSVLGPRGTGKTTLLLQHMKESPGAAQTSLYLSLDNIWLSAREAYEVAEHHVKHGGTELYLDEVHFLDGWQTLVKNLNDDFRRLRIAYTGSAMLRIEKSGGDLSRRQSVNKLPPMSFREYLNFEGLGPFEPLSLPEILAGHVSLSRDILSRLGTVLPHFEAYLDHGAYPFYKEAGREFGDMLRQTVNQVLDVDWPKTENVEPQTIRHAREMLSILASTPPQTPNVTALCRELDVDRKQGIRILGALARSGLLKLLSTSAKKLKTLSTPDKLYCGDPNLMCAMTPKPDKGTLRETFVLSQLEAVASVDYPPQGDFLVNGRYLLEVGGAGKKYRQIADIPDSFLAVDDLEIGRGNRIPIWLFGFLY